MKINDVYYTNLVELLRVFQEDINRNVVVNTFQESLNAYLSMVSIKLRNVEVNGLEVFYLKNFSSSLEIVDIRYQPLKKYVFPFQDINDSFERSKGLYDQYRSISTDDSHIGYDLLSQFPLVNLKFVVNVSFTKNKVFNAITPFPYREIPKDLYMDETRTNDFDIVLRRLIESQFKTFMDECIGEVSGTTDYYLEQNFYKYRNKAPKDSCFTPTLSNVSHLYGNIRFFNNTPEGLKNEIVLCKSITQMNNRRNELEYVFVIETNVFLFLMMYLTTDWVINHQSLISIIATEENQRFLIYDVDEAEHAKKVFNLQVIRDNLIKSMCEEQVFLSKNRENQISNDSITTSNTNYEITREMISLLLPASTSMVCMIKLTKKELNQLIVDNSYPKTTNKDLNQPKDSEWVLTPKVNPKNCINQYIRYDDYMNLRKLMASVEYSLFPPQTKG